MTYTPETIEKKWQQIWAELRIFEARDDHSLPKYYVLVEFPYPSGEGLHVGHPRSYTALDVIARKRRMEGYNVLFPMGWDAFGLPTENFAIKHKVHPAAVTARNTDRYRQQLQMLGISFDWSREINTTSSDYYRWTQWIFLRLFEQGLAYKDKKAINWCSACKIGLANEEVVAGTCERCGHTVEKRVRSQWMLRITAYADKLLQGLENLDCSDRIKTQQRNWIGRSQGAKIKFPLRGMDSCLEVFTTRPDTCLESPSWSWPRSIVCWTN